MDSGVIIDSVSNSMGLDVPLNEAEKVFDLLEKLIDGQDALYRDDVDPNAVWRANFIGEPSLRHANRISILRDFLDSVLPVDVETVAAKIGSVVVDFAPADTASPGFLDASRALSTDRQAFQEIATRIGLRSLSFAGTELIF